MTKISESITNSNHRPVLHDIADREGVAGVARAVREAMPLILRHCVECTWAACYNTKFRELIWPFLNDVTVLSDFLKSDAIQPTRGVLAGNSGAKIFPHLL